MKFLIWRPLCNLVTRNKNLRRLCFGSLSRQFERVTLRRIKRIRTLSAISKSNRMYDFTLIRRLDEKTVEYKSTTLKKVRNTSFTNLKQNTDATKVDRTKIRQNEQLTFYNRKCLNIKRSYYETD